MRVLLACRGNQTCAARELNMHRNTLSRTITELNLQPEINRMGLRRGPGAMDRQRTLVKRPVTGVSNAAISGQQSA